MTGALVLAALLSAAPSPFPPDVYRARREKVIESLKGCVAVLYARTGTPTVRGTAIDSQFYWLTGVAEPGAALLLAPHDPLRRHSLYLAERKPEEERWTGPRDPIQPALRRKLGFDRVVRTPQLKTDLFDALRRAPCAARIDANTSPDAPERKLLGEVLSAFDLPPVRQAWAPLERLRTVKEPRERERMERAIAITLQGHAAAAAALREGATETEVARALLGELQRGGAIDVAYDPIVGTGADGAVLHWEPHAEPLRADDVVLIDAGAAYLDYAADVTRTYPVSGRFGPEQRKVYDAVLAAQEAAFRAIKRGATLVDLHRAAENAIVEAGYPEGLVHFVGHYLGLDVHDPGDRAQPLEPGMIFTVEPGIYLPERRIGVRIEDVVEVTPGGWRLLTKDLPRTADEVERFVARSRGR